MTRPSTAAPIQPAALPRMARLVRIYHLYTVGLLCFYFASPAIAHLMYWDYLPQVGLSTVHAFLLIPAFGARLLLFLTGQLKIRTKYLALTYLLLMWISMLQLMWFPSLSTQIGLQSVLSNMAFTLLGAWLLALGGESFAYLSLAMPWVIRRLVYAIYVGLALVVVDGVIKGIALYGQLVFAFKDPLSDQIYNYLALGDSIAIMGLVILNWLGRHALYRGIGVCFSTLLLLFFSYSRSNFFCFLLTAVPVLIQKFWRTRKHQLLLAMMGAAVVSMIAFLALPIYDQVRENLFGRSRLLLERFSAPFLGVDASLQTRHELFRQGLSLLQRHWLLGYFMGEVVELEKGAYIHNWLSFWLAYGIGPFLLSMWLLFSLIVKQWYEWKRGSEALAGLSVLMFILLSIGLSRSYIWPYFWFGLSFAGTHLPIKKER